MRRSSPVSGAGSCSAAGTAPAAARDGRERVYKDGNDSTILF